MTKIASSNFVCSENNGQMCGGGEQQKPSSLDENLFTDESGQAFFDDDDHGEKGGGSAVENNEFINGGSPGYPPSGYCRQTELNNQQKPPFKFKQEHRMPHICTNCNQPISDRFNLRVNPDMDFHDSCLMCVECKYSLDEHCTAFVRDGKTYCRGDYLRLFGPALQAARAARCQRCKMQFQRSDLVMRARDLMFHMSCFNCTFCHRILNTGEQYQLRQNELFCLPCFMLSQQQQHNFPAPPQSMTGQLPPPFQSVISRNFSQPLSQLPSSLIMAGGGAGGIGGCSMFEEAKEMNGVQKPPSTLYQQSPITGQQQQNQFPLNPSISSSANSPLSYSNPDSVISSTNGSTPNHSINANANMDTSNGTVIAISGGAVAQFANGVTGTSSTTSSSSNSITTSITHKKHRSKGDKPAQRVRTVLNEHQLKILKQTYCANQRPDTVTKEHLVEMTGLNQRVIRVWFQNKRCKDKKRQIQQREMQQHQEKEQTLHEVRMTGIGPLTTPTPLTIQNDSQSVADATAGAVNGFSPTPTEIRHYPQNPLLWGISEGQQSSGVSSAEQQQINANQIPLQIPSFHMPIPPPIMMLHGLQSPPYPLAGMNFN